MGSGDIIKNVKICSGILQLISAVWKCMPQITTPNKATLTYNQIMEMTKLHETCISDHLRLKTTLTDNMRSSQISLVALTCATYCNAHTEQI